MSDCLGISTETVDIITFGIGSGLAGVAGVAVSLLDQWDQMLVVITLWDVLWLLFLVESAIY